MHYKDKSRTQIQADIRHWIQQSIRDRTLEEWPEVNYNFDPLIELLIGSMSTELEQVYGYIYDSEKRLMAQLLRILLPESVQISQPAHAIATGRPMSGQMELGNNNQFYYLDPKKQAEDIKETGIGWIPILPTTLHSGEVSFVATDTAIFAMQRNHDTFLPPPDYHQYFSQLYIGLTIDESVSILRNLTIYSDLRSNPLNPSSVEEERAFTYALQSADWSYQHQTLQVELGLEKPIQEVNELLDPVAYTRQAVLQAYNPFFFKVRTKIDVQTGGQDFPTAIAEQLSTAAQQAILSQVQSNKQRLVWLTVNFPHMVHVQDFQSKFRCAINFFPVINWVLQTKEDGTYFNKSSVNAVHISSTRTVLGIHRVYPRNDEHNTYTYSPFSKFNMRTPNTYTVRYGGVGATDNYNTWKGLLHLINLARKSYKYQELRDQLNGELSLEEWSFLLQHEQANVEMYQDCYIILNVGNLKDAGKRVMIEYWETDGEAGNQILKDSLLIDPSQEISPLLTPQGIRLVSTSTGGSRGKQTITEQKHLLRSSLLSRDRIVTLADVENFVRRYVSDEQVDIDVKRGVIIDRRPGFSPTRVIEVRITLPKEHQEQSEHWSHLRKHLENELTSRSISVIPYRINFYETIPA